MAEVNDNSSIQLFEDQKIRTAWDAEKEEWYFAIVDVIAVLTDSADPQNYWRVLKKRLKDEGNETITNCNGLKMTAPDGKKRKTDVANTEQLLRIIQSIPSPKAEPFKAWLAMVGKERIEETIDPEQAIDRALDTYDWALGKDPNAKDMPLWVVPNKKVSVADVEACMRDHYEGRLKICHI